MSDINDIWLEQAEKIQKAAEWNCGEHEDFSQEHIEKCLDEMLVAYISDERNYVVDCAEIECTEMCSTAHCIKYENGKTRLYDIIKDDEKGVERDYIPSGNKQGEIHFFGKEFDMATFRRLFALHAKEADDNGIRYATVADTTCLRDVNEGTGHLMSPAEGKLSNPACIVSCGNCGIFKKSDIGEIEKRLDESKKYGTCYTLIKPVTEWVNPLCVESMSGNCSHTPKDVMSGSGLPLSMTSSDRTDHHKTMKFDTKYGLKEGLTMLSTLLCTRGGVITIKVHGQIYLEPTIEDSLSEDEIIFIATIYGEGTTYSKETRQAIAHAIMNRIGVREWSDYTTYTMVIQESGFDAFNEQQYSDAVEYLNNRDYSNQIIEDVIDAVLPICRGEIKDTTNNVVLFYSPKTQEEKHKKNPSKYKNPPSFVNEKVEEVHIAGSENDDIKFYRYKD